MDSTKPAAEKGSVEKCSDSCEGLCTGEAWWPWNVLCCPMVLFWNSIRIYLCTCVGVILFRFYDAVCCFCVRSCCPDYYYYVDEDFPANPSSLASKEKPEEYKSSTFAGKSYREVDDKTGWLRPHEFLEKWVNRHQSIRDKTEDEEEEKEYMQLFQDDVDPSDVCQGKLGDCWLMAALAALAEFPESIKNVFLTKEYNPQGKYRLRLFDMFTDEWVIITIDDRIPVDQDDNEPIFATPKGKELWVHLIEKAFAKYCWGYSNLSGGHALWAFAVITGDVAFRLEWNKKKNIWERCNLKNKKYNNPEQKNPSERYVLTMDDDRFDDLKIWELILEYNKRRSVMICSKSNQGESQDDRTGIVAGHAYTLIGAVDYNGIRLLQLRNPWGEFEWKGKWSDGDAAWDKYPGAKEACDYENVDDGVFWIEWEDFKENYDVVQICHRTTKFDLHLDVNEDDGMCGVCAGCLWGCAKYWLCCEGFRRIYCGERSSDEVVETTCCFGLCADGEGKKWDAKSPNE